MKREEQKINDTWNLEKIYKNTDELKSDLSKANEIIDEICTNKNDLFITKEKFISNMKKIFGYEYLIEKSYVYAHHTLDQDLSNSSSQELVNLVEGVYYKNAQKLDFLKPLLLETEDTILKYLEDENLKDFKKYFNNIFRFNKYTLTKKEERIMALSMALASLPYQAYTSLTDSEFIYEDIKVEGEVYKLTSGSYSTYLSSTNKEIRRKAFENTYKVYGKYNNTLSILLNGQIKSSLFERNARGYNSTIESALYSNAIEVDVYNNLINTINDKMYINHQYISLRKKILDVEELNLYDMYVPLLSEYDKEIKYDEAKEILSLALEPLGSKYLELLNTSFNNRWIDLYENEGKRSGAYSGGAYKTPPYILMNYTNKINDLYTLAHELGHSLHTYFSNENQKFHNAHYKIFIAEVASTVNELLLTYYLLEKANDSKERAYILNYLLEQFRTTVVRQTMFAEFEQQIHAYVQENDAITKDELNSKYYDLNKKYFGNDIIINEEIKYEWSRIPHFYYNFYVYQYATSFCAAVDIAKRIYNKESGFVDKYINFLSLGNSVYPLEALQTIGIDLTDKNIIGRAMDEYEKVLNDFKKVIL